MKDLFTGLLLLLIGTAYAQETTISGQVTDAETGEALIGANVVVQGTTNGTVTDIDGNYQLTVSSPDNTLVFSYVGYDPVEIQINNQTTINAQLGLNLEELEEVVVIGYGTVRKSDLTGSVSQIEGEELVKVPSVNPMQALQGKVAGMQVTSSSGAPGDAPVVRVRGVGTTGNPDPIYVVDGMIVNNIDFLNASDIESMEVLKDASATAIYGSRGANGVIMITTKLGEKGTEPTISVNAEYSLQVLQRRIDLLDGREFAEVVNEIAPGTYNNINRLPSTDWQDLLYEVAPIHNYQVSLSGATDLNQYYFGLGYFEQDGIIPESSYKRVTLKINDRFSPREYMSFGTNMTIAPYTRDNTVGNAPFMVYRAQPVVAPYDDQGNYNEVPGVGNVLGALEYETDNVTRGIRSVGNLFAEAYFLDGFTFKTSLGLDVRYWEEEQFTPVYQISSEQQNQVSRLRKRNATYYSWIWENTLNYDKEIGLHRINAVIGYTTQETGNEYLQLVGRDLFRTGENFRYIDPNNVVPGELDNEVEVGDNFSMISYLGRINYSFDSRYLFTFTFRRDGSSKFLENNQYGNFPAVALGWNIINEAFFPQQGVISNLKLRASWGIIGNEKIDFDAAYSPVNNNVNAVFGLGSESLFFGQTYGRLGNPNLTWEEVKSLDIGLEFGFLNERLTGELDYYNRLTDDILIDLNIPRYLGTGDPVTYNAGSVRNTGFEFNVNWRDELGDFRYSAGVVGSTINNEIEEVSGTGGADDELLGITNNITVSRTANGLPIGAFYGYNVIGIFQTEEQITNTPSLANTEPGDLIFEDTNEDGVLNGDDRTYLGSPIPDVQYGLLLNVGYKSFDLSLDFQGQAGNEIYDIKETIRPALYNFEQHVYDFWRGEGTSAEEPRPTAGGNNFQPSSRFIEDGSFFRLRNVTLAYSLDQSLLEGLDLSSVNVFVRGTNVFTLMDFTGYSPEITNSNPLLNGVALGTFPVSSVYSVGFNASF